MILRLLPGNAMPKIRLQSFKKVRRTFWPFGSKKDDKKEDKIQEEKEIKDYGNLGFLVKEVKQHNLSIGTENS